MKMYKLSVKFHSFVVFLFFVSGLLFPKQFPKPSAHEMQTYLKHCLFLCFPYSYPNSVHCFLSCIYFSFLSQKTQLPMSLLPLVLFGFVLLFEMKGKNKAMEKWISDFAP